MALDQAQQKALNALEAYVLLSKSATSPRAAINLISQATSAPNVFVFAELLQTPNIQSLRTASPEHAIHLTVLEIFSWGIWSDYTATPDLPPLSDAQALKLRQLTLLSLSTSHDTLTYSYLLSALSLPTIRALEDLVISSIYAGLLTAKLDTLTKRVDVSSVSPLRDLRPNSVPQMVAVFDDWDGRCVSVLAEIESHIRDVRKSAAERRRREKEHESNVEKAMDDEASRGDKGKSGGKRGVGETESGEGYDVDRGEAMEVDETLGRGGQRNAKRGGRFGGLGKR